MTTSEYEKKLHEVNDIIQDALEKKRLLKEEYGKSFLEASGLKPGDRIKDYKGNEYEVVKADVFMTGVAHLIGRKIKKDGTPGEREVTVYGYELKRP